MTCDTNLDAFCQAVHYTSPPYLHCLLTLSIMSGNIWQYGNKTQYESIFSFKDNKPQFEFLNQLRFSKNRKMIYHYHTQSEASVLHKMAELYSLPCLMWWFGSRFTSQSWLGTSNMMIKKLHLHFSLRKSSSINRQF